ncbi:hypothetical protein ACFHWD_03180 [Clostridium sp. MT-14]|uniref:hypothetical protein n=1 Tax=Clostridium sp. MT-14 TaxID=3348360 RepID=UPI0035F2EAD9
MCWAYDIKPEDDSIIKQDFLALDINYLDGRLIIGNPPYGTRNILAVKFYKKSIQLGDYIAFILPISQLYNTQQMYEFDLIYSEDLGIKEYSNIKLHCCFNIYKRPETGVFNKKPNYKLKDVEIKEYRRNGTYKKPEYYDFGMCTWGNGTCGKEVEYIGQYALELYIIINNPKYHKQIIDLCKNTDWKHLCSSISMARLPMWRVYKYIKEQIPEIK